VACNCNQTKRFKVIRPDGQTIIKNSRAAAELAKAKYPGSTIEEAK